MHRPARFLTLVATLTLTASPAMAGYGLSPFNIAGAGGTSPDGINNAGVVVGSYVGADGVTRGFIGNGTSPGQYQDVVYGTNTDTEVYGINNAGVSVGLTIDATGVGHGFTRDAAGVLSLLPDYSATATTFAVAINNSGVIAGIESEDNFNSASGLIYTPGQGYTKLDFAGALYTIPRAVTDAGIVYGWIETPTFDVHGFRYDPNAPLADRYLQIDVAGALGTVIYGASLNGSLLAGTVFDNTGTGSHAFVMTGSGSQLFDYPGAGDTQGGGINDSGVFVGTYNQFAGGFIGTPASVPEPSSLVLTGLAGLILVGYRMGRRA